MNKKKKMHSVCLFASLMFTGFPVKTMLKVYVQIILLAMQVSRFIPVTFYVGIERMFMICFAEASFKNWKAKEGECEEKCEGSTRPYVIIAECKLDTAFSCDGLKVWLPKCSKIR